jgi:hypothetical protein
MLWSKIAISFFFLFARLLGTEATDMSQVIADVRPMRAGLTI